MTFAALLFVNCDLFDWDKLLEQDPTKTRMEGVWEVTEAYTADGTSILSDISFPVTAFHLSTDQTVVSTAGPMIMYLVYGKSNYTKIAAKVDQVFNYAKLNFNGGEWFIDGGVVDRFTLEMKLEGLPGQSAVTTLLGLLNIGSDYLDIVIYHKFMDVRVEFEDFNDTVMTWHFDDYTIPEYNKKDSKGNYVAWNGFQPANFTRGKFVLRKRTRNLTDLVNAVKE